MGSLLTVAFVFLKFHSIQFVSLVLFAESFWCPLRKPLLIPTSLSTLLLYSSSHFRVSSWFLYTVKSTDLILSFYMWLTNFPIIICWGNYLFSDVYLLKRRWLSLLGLLWFLLIYSIDLHVYICANALLGLLLLLCGMTLSQVWWYLQSYSFFLGLLTIGSILLTYDF